MLGTTSPPTDGKRFKLSPGKSWLSELHTLVNELGTSYNGYSIQRHCIWVKFQLSDHNLFRPREVHSSKSELCSTSVWAIRNQITIAHFLMTQVVNHVWWPWLNKKKNIATSANLSEFSRSVVRLVAKVFRCKLQIQHLVSFRKRSVI